MSTHSKSYQLVFLIDVNIIQKHPLSNDRNDDISNTVRLSTLKLLTYFANKDDTRCGVDKIKWGYKFYNNNKSKTPRQNFRDFTHKNFEIFEKELCSCFEKERSSSPRQERDGRSSVDHFGKVCRELLLDFQWDRPDISSPVRQPRRSLAQDESGPYNVVFLFSDCPRSRVDLACYLGGCAGSDITVDNAGVFLNSFMPHQLYRQFYENTKIRLFWIDTGSFSQAHHVSANQNESQNDLAGITLIDEALRLIGGCVVPISSLINMGVAATVNILSVMRSHNCGSSTSDTDSVRTAHPDLLLPLSCVMAGFTDRDTGYRWETLKPGLISHCQLVMPMGNGRVNVMCDLKLQSIISAANNDSIKSSESNKCTRNHRNRSMVNTETVDISFPSSTADHHAENKMSADEDRLHRVTFSVESNQQAHESQAQVTCVRLTACGTIKQSSMPLCCLESSEIWLCSQQNNSDVFPGVIRQLAQSHLALVVEYEDPHTKLHLMGLIKPLTSVCATFTRVQTRMRLALEKLLWQGRSLWGASGKSSPAGLRHFVKTSMKHIMKSVSKPSALLKGLDKSSPTEMESDEMVTEAFRSSCVESWYEPSATSSTQLQGLIQDINSVEATDNEVLEGHVIKDVQRWYRKVKSHFLDVKKPDKENIKSPRRSPRKACKTPKKNHATKFKQGALDAVRKSPRLKRSNSGPVAPTRGELMRQLSKQVSSKQTTKKKKVPTATLR